jgi:hypothetical protein
MATAPKVKRRNDVPPRPRKYDETELRMIRAGLAEQAKARYIRRTRGVG